MNYQEALEYIHGTLRFGSKLGLHNMQVLLGLMGDPHKKLKYVHVAGTNGKGSIVSFLSSILMEAGYKVGIFTSPYIQRFSERIKINRQEIAGEDLARITAFVKEKVEQMVAQGENHPTEFEIVTAIAFQYYLESGCDIVVLEVGLGGRFDSTNIIGTPEAAVISTIGYDHMEWLGDTLPRIAFEKAGIIKPEGDVILYPQPEEVELVFSEVCAQRGARLHRVDFSGMELLEYGDGGQCFHWCDYKNIKINLIGEHQTKNAAVAITAAEVLTKKGWRLEKESIRRGLEAARWPGRLEILSREPMFIIDAAHNPEGARALRSALDTYFPEKRRIFIMGVMKDKDYKVMIETVIPGADRVVTLTPENPRALRADELANNVRRYCKSVSVSDTIEHAVKVSLEAATPDSLVCAFGSLYFIGGVRDYFQRV